MYSAIVLRFYAVWYAIWVSRFFAVLTTLVVIVTTAICTVFCTLLSLSTCHYWTYEFVVFAVPVARDLLYIHPAAAVAAAANDHALIIYKVPML